MKKTDLTDTTFYILVRIDSIQRLENILLVTKLFCKYFSTNISVREADSFNNGILERLLHKSIAYEFVEDRDPVLHRTWHHNQMIGASDSTYVAIWDADIIPFKDAVTECLHRLRKNQADFALPYNGLCYDVAGAIKSLFVQRKNYKVLSDHSDKLHLLYPTVLYGGAVILSKDAFMKSGGENEKQYGWSNDDSDRYNRIKSLQLSIFRYHAPLFHLWHPRSENSRFHSDTFKKISINELFLLQNSSYQEMLEYISRMESFREINEL